MSNRISSDMLQAAEARGEVDVRSRESFIAFDDATTHALTFYGEDIKEQRSGEALLCELAGCVDRPLPVVPIGTS